MPRVSNTIDPIVDKEIIFKALTYNQSTFRGKTKTLSIEQIKERFGVSNFTASKLRREWKEIEQCTV